MIITLSVIGTIIALMILHQIGYMVSDEEPYGFSDVIENILIGSLITVFIILIVGLLFGGFHYIFTKLL